jgi:hypothetical protein
VDVAEAVNGDHGLEDARELRDILLLPGKGGTGGISLAENEWLRCVALARFRGALIVGTPSSGSSFVELFHLGALTLTPCSSTTRRTEGDDSGVKLWLCLCRDRSGVIVFVIELARGNREARCLSFGAGSEAGSGLSTFDEVGVVLPPLLNRLASFRNGDIDRDRAN